MTGQQRFLASVLGSLLAAIGFGLLHSFAWYFQPNGEPLAALAGCVFFSIATAILLVKFVYRKRFAPLQGLIVSNIDEKRRRQANIEPIVLLPVLGQPSYRTVLRFLTSMSAIIYWRWGLEVAEKFPALYKAMRNFGCTAHDNLGVSLWIRTVMDEDWPNNTGFIYQYPDRALYRDESGNFIDIWLIIGQDKPVKSG